MVAAGLKCWRARSAAIGSTAFVCLTIGKIRVRFDVGSIVFIFSFFFFLTYQKIRHGFEFRVFGAMPRPDPDPKMPQY